MYQHDTPDKNLFAKEERAFSHGCMRVQNPDQYASILLNITTPNEHYTPDKIRSMYGHSEIDLKFSTPIPVNITYQTAFVDEAGKLQFRKDVYGRDATMLALLKNGGTQGSGERGGAFAAELFAPDRQSAARRQLRQRQYRLFFGTVLLRAAVRSADTGAAAGPCRPPTGAAAGLYPLIACATGGRTNRIP